MKFYLYRETSASRGDIVVRNCIATLADEPNGMPLFDPDDPCHAPYC